MQPTEYAAAWSDCHMMSCLAKSRRPMPASKRDGANLDALRERAQLGEAGSSIAVQLVGFRIDVWGASRQRLRVVLDCIWIAGFRKSLPT